MKMNMNSRAPDTLAEAYRIIEEALLRIPERIGEAAGPEAARVSRERVEVLLSEVRTNFGMQ